MAGANSRTWESKTRGTSAAPRVPEIMGFTDKEEMRMSMIKGCVAFIACGLFVLPVWADNEKKEDEQKEHATARKVLAAAKIDLQKAIQTAQAKVPDGKLLEAETEVEEGKNIFEVSFLVGDKIREVDVDAATGAVLEVEDSKADADEIADAKKLLGASKTTFAQAIATALDKVKDGKPFEVELDSEDGKTIIEVELLSGNKIMQVEIDAVTGKVLEVEEE
jgi:uncharacterized membrane protein YkoI